MASAFGHALASFAIGKTFSKDLMKPMVFILGIISSILPDADVLAFRFDIPYEAPLGHRGFTHSILFAILWAGLLIIVFHRKSLSKWLLWFYYFIATISHGILDALTTGGRGVGFFIPIDMERYFLPFSLIKVSPMSAAKFFSEWGLEVIKSEAVWIGIPSIIVILGAWVARYNRS